MAAPQTAQATGRPSRATWPKSMAARTRNAQAPAAASTPITSSRTLGQCRGRDCVFVSALRRPALDGSSFGHTHGHGDILADIAGRHLDKRNRNRHGYVSYETFGGGQVACRDLAVDRLGVPF